jgi:hypothetical protein
MSVNLFSRYRSLPTLEINHAQKGVTRSLPIRKPTSPTQIEIARQHRFGSYETADLLALKYFNREELYWHLLDANDGRLPDDFKPGELLNIPPLSLATRVEITVL